MTCEEFRELVILDRMADEVTRATRAAVGRHARECPGCRRHLFGLLAEYAARPGVDVAAEFAAALAGSAADREDPEFRATVDAARPGGLDCGAFQTLAVEHGDARNLTVADRAALVAHARGCVACAAWVMARVNALAAAGVDVNRQLAMARRLGDEDRKDPEFRRITEGG